MVARLVGTRCIRSRSAAMRTSGIKANGIPNDKITCDKISNRVGSRPNPSKINAGMAVSSRRQMIGIRRRSKPSMITDPAYPPTEVEAKPDARRAKANNPASTGPSSAAIALSTYATAATNAGPSNQVRCSSASLCSNINSNALFWELLAELLAHRRSQLLQEATAGPGAEPTVTAAVAEPPIPDHGQ